MSPQYRTGIPIVAYFRAREDELTDSKHARILTSRMALAFHPAGPPLKLECEGKLKLPRGIAERHACD
jgi:hypothetical protein